MQVQQTSAGGFAYQQTDKPLPGLTQQINHLLINLSKTEPVSNLEQTKITELFQQYLGMEDHATTSTLTSEIFEKRTNWLLDFALAAWIKNNPVVPNAIARGWNSCFTAIVPPPVQAELNYYLCPHLTKVNSFYESVGERAVAGSTVARNAMDTPKIKDMYAFLGLSPDQVRAKVAYQQFLLLESKLPLTEILPYLFEAVNGSLIPAIIKLLFLNQQKPFLKPAQVSYFEAQLASVN